jgi:DNA-binding XRE family transcriptional regulator
MEAQKEEPSHALEAGAVRGDASGEDRPSSSSGGASGTGGGGSAERAAQEKASADRASADRASADRAASEKKRAREGKEAGSKDSRDDDPPKQAATPAEGRSAQKGPPLGKDGKPGNGNNVRKLRMERMMSKAELARRAGVSTLTIDRVEHGYSCRMDTKLKILEALGLKPSDRVMVFGDED